MPRSRGAILRDKPPLELAQRLQSILVNTAEGRRSVGDDAEYPELRGELIRRKLVRPKLLSTHPTLDSFSAHMRNTGDKRQRAVMVREDFEPLLASLAEDVAPDSDSSGWTGKRSRAARLEAARALLPVARAAVESLIEELAKPGSNNGPILDERAEAVEHLRNLHRTLGELLLTIDAGHFDDELGQGLAREAVDFAQRAAEAVQGDPMPYISASLIFAVLATCGLEGTGGLLSSILLGFQKSKGS
jgi:hypothetical protein